MRATYLFTLVVVGASQAHASDPSPQPKPLQDITRCRSIAEPNPRLACYDAAATTIADALEKRTIVVLDKAEVQRTRRSLFGFPLPNLPFFGNSGGRTDSPQDKAEVRELATSIKSVGQSGYGLWSMTLAEGGTWHTTEPDRTFEPRAGQSIVIKRGPVGGYMARIGGQRAVRVQRVG